MLVNQVGALSERPPVGHGIWLTTIVGALSERPLMERHGDALTLYVNGYVRDIDSAVDLMIEEFCAGSNQAVFEIRFVRLEREEGFLGADRPDGHEVA